MDPQDSSRVGLSFDAPDLDALMAALQTPAAAAMEHDGAMPETLVMLVES